MSDHALIARKKAIGAGREQGRPAPGMNFAVGGAGVVEGTHEAPKHGTQVDRFRSLLACLAWMWMSTTKLKTAWLEQYAPYICTRLACSTGPIYS